MSRGDPRVDHRVRPLMVLVGLAVLAVYLGFAALVYLALVTLWSLRPSLPVAVLVVLATTAVSGLLSYRYGTARLLSSLNAVAVPRQRAPGLYRRLDGLCERMALETPTLLLASMPEPNAVALGGVRGGAVVLDRSLVAMLSDAELEAILAHELAHIESHDGLVQTMAYSVFQTLVGLVMLALSPLLFALTGLARATAWMGGRPAAWSETPFGWLRTRVTSAVVVVMLVLTLVVLAHSRRREYAADDRAVEVTARPLELARALHKIRAAAEPERSLLSPLYVRGEVDDPLSGWLSTHPSIEDRIDRLLERVGREPGPPQR